MATLNHFLDGLARDLNDAEKAHEYARWTKVQLLDYLNEGLRVAAFFKPELFSQTKVIQLSPGTDQQAPDATFVTRVVAQTDEFGNMLYGQLPKRAPAAMFRWNKAGCPPKHPFKLRGYWIESDGSNEFSVTPPVPVDPPVYVKLRMLEEPDDLTPADYDSEFLDSGTAPALRQWVLYRAMFIDDESQTASAAALHHLELFFNLLRIQFTRELVAKIGAAPSPAVRNLISIMRGTGMIGAQV